MKRSGFKRSLIFIFCGAGIISLCFAGFISIAILRLPPLDDAALNARSTVVLDANGDLLRPFTTPDGRWRLPVHVEDVDPRFMALLTAFEDRRFFHHPGVDPLAALRAFGQSLRHGRIVSGGSTLTMQAARLMEPRQERSLSSKLHQILRAIWLEQSVTKTDILNTYLALAPYGGNIEGVRAASLAYFGKEPRRLSLGEAALLVALPQSPEARRPDRVTTPERESRLLLARARVLDSGVAMGVISSADAERARDEALPFMRKPFPLLAAHVAEAEVKQNPHLQQHILTIHREKQQALENLVSERITALGPHLSMAVVVISHADGAIRASVGGVRYLDSQRAGGVDLTRAIRSPGSALKPFIYAMAFEDGIAHPETWLEDRPSRYGAYAPDNFDTSFQGIVSARLALQNSLNIPAIDLMTRVGPQRFIARLKTAGVDIHLPDDSVAGLSVALGGLGITLTDMVALYGGIARGGQALPLILTRSYENNARQERRLTDSVSAWYITDILKGAPPPPNAPFGKIAFKTGTSYGYRDAWAIGYDRRHVIGVWVGRPDGASVPGLVGRVAAAPILFDAFSRIGIEAEPFIMPPSALQATHSTLPAPLKHIRQDVAKTASLGTPVLKIAFPPADARVDVKSSAVAGATYGDVLLKAQGGTPPFVWLVNGKPVVTHDYRRSTSWSADSLGFTHISVMDAKGITDSVTVRLE